LRHTNPKGIEMIAGRTLQNLAAKGAKVHRVTRDYGAKFAAEHPDFPRYSVNHFATKAQADKDMAGVFSEVVKPVYDTVPAAELAKAPGASDFFYILT